MEDINVKEAINFRLRELKLSEFTTIGDADQPTQWVLLGIKEIYDHSARFFYDIKFDALMPPKKGETERRSAEYTVRFNANSAESHGVVIIPFLGQKIVFVRQWRLTVARETLELPRGFGLLRRDTDIKAIPVEQIGRLRISDLPVLNVLRELGEEVFSQAEITGFTYYGTVDQNTGTDAMEPNIYGVHIHTGAKLGGSEGLAVLPLMPDEIWPRIADGRIRDLHTLGGLMKLKAYQQLSPAL